jgi:hypothetical protein
MKIVLSKVVHLHNELGHERMVASMTFNNPFHSKQGSHILGLDNNNYRFIVTRN